MTTSEYALVLLGLRRARFVAEVVHKNDDQLKEEAVTALFAAVDQLKMLFSEYDPGFNAELFEAAWWEPLNEREAKALENELSHQLAMRLPPDRPNFDKPFEEDYCGGKTLAEEFGWEEA
jgi:hypothetical protein